MRTTAVALLLAAVAAHAQQPAGGGFEKARPALQEWMTATPEARPAAWEKLKAASEGVILTKKEMEAAEKILLAGNTKAKGKSGQTFFDVGEGAGKTATHLRVPPSVKPSTPAPMVVILHGGGPGDYESAKKHALDMVSWWGKHSDSIGAILLAPSAAGDWGGARANVWESIRRARETHNIDPNRIYLYGGSMGGFGVCQFAVEKPEVWAAAAPFIGCSDLTDYASSFRNIPFYIVIGEKDMEAMNRGARATAAKLKELGFDVTFREQKGKGHEVPPSEYPPLMKKFAATTRNLHAPHISRARGTGVWGWLDGSGDLDGVAAGQTLTITGPSSVRVLLSDRLADLDKPVVVILNGTRVFEGKVERSLAFLVRHVEETGDTARTFCNEIRVP